MGRSSALIGYSTNSIHAEDAGMNKFNRINNYKRIINRSDTLDILVIRISRSGILGNSRPCKNCIRRLGKLGHKIKHVYYTTNEGSIVREKFDQMLASPLTMLSSGDRNRNRTVETRGTRKTRKTCKTRKTRKTRKTDRQAK